VKIAIVSNHVPEPQGTAAGRQLLAVGDALVAAGHELTAWSWRPVPPAGAVPSWCEWSPLPGEAWWRTRARALRRPRADIVTARWRPPPDAVCVADDPGSFAAVAVAGRRSVATVHYSVALDRAARRDWSPPHVQDWRAEHRAVHHAGLVWTLSERVRRRVGRGIVVPATLPMPDAALPVVDAPVVALLADWRWPPNVDAARVLLDGWPSIRARVTGARLLLAGRGASPVGAVAGVEWRGEVPTTADLLAESALLAFPAPATSGPKMKVLDALAHGVPVVTTVAGEEGIAHGGGAVVADVPGFADAVVALLSDPARRARLAAAGRAAVLAAHSPQVAAQQRVASLAAGATAPA
jgi:hypothetical protein